MRCPHCGNMIGGEDLYCPFCHEQIDEADLADTHERLLDDLDDDDIDNVALDREVQRRRDIDDGLDEDDDLDYLDDQSGPEDFDDNIEEDPDEIW